MIQKKKIIFILSFLVSFLIFVTFFIIYLITFNNKVYFRVYFGSQLLSGKNKVELNSKIKKITDDYSKEKIEIYYKDKKWELNIKDLIIHYQTEEIINLAYQKGRENNFILNLVNRLILPFKPAYIPNQFVLNNKYLDEKLKEIKKEVENPLKEGFLKIDQGKVYINKTKEGIILKEDYLKKDINERLIDLKCDSIEIVTEKIHSNLSEEELQRVKQETEKIISSPIILSHESIVHRIGSQKLGEWLKFDLEPWNWNTLNNQEKLILDNYLIKILNLDKFPLQKTKIKISLDEEQINNYLKDFAQKNINIEPQNATLKVENGKVIIEKPEINGKFLDIEDTFNQIKKALLEDGERQIKLTVVPNLAEVRSDNYLELGIQELIASGYSNFAGSPPNRIHNIFIGASKVNGALIKPGETFSLNKMIGPVEAETGFLPELVIKENKTVPEYGGGLCQIGTTCFRAALNAGLPILERKNHAYIVQYYMPVGTDATIYPPHPDVVFRNDTSGYILIQTRIEGNYLYFDFYGTKGDKKCKFNGTASLDGAVDNVENVIPNIYNQKTDGSAEAEFYRFIFKGEQLIKTERYHSYYESPSKYPH